MLTACVLNSVVTPTANAHRRLQEHLYAPRSCFFSTIHSETISRATAIIYSIMNETKAHVLDVQIQVNNARGRRALPLHLSVHVILLISYAPSIRIHIRIALRVQLNLRECVFVFIPTSDAYKRIWHLHPPIERRKLMCISAFEGVRRVCDSKNVIVCFTRHPHRVCVCAPFPFAHYPNISINAGSIIRNTVLAL